MGETKNCVRTASDLRLQAAYCQYITQSFKFALDALAEIIPRRMSEPNKTIVMDFDAVFASEDSCTNYEMFTCAVNFVKSVKGTYGNLVRVVIITARQELDDLWNDLWTVGLTYGPTGMISNIMYDSTFIGTEGSKLRNRRILRDNGATIIASIGDNITDLVCDVETDMYANTLNILLPNIYRHVSLED